MSSNYFGYTLLKKPGRSKFDMSYENKLTLDMGQLVPIFQMDVVPGDIIKNHSEIFIRFMPLLAPIMHQVDCYLHWFFVPYRLVWEDWKKFISEGDGSSGVQVSPQFPRVPIGTFDGAIGQNSLCDYLGYYTTGSGNDEEVSLLPLRAYQMIYNEYYRDESIQPPNLFSVQSGSVDPRPTSAIAPQLTGGTNLTKAQAIANLVTLRYRDWEKDYFTSALAEPQRGYEAEVLLKNLAPNTGIGESDTLVQSKGTILDTISPKVAGSLSSGDIKTTSTGVLQDSSGTSIMIQSSTSGANDSNGYHRHLLNLSDLGFTINELRLANSIQKWLERANIGGNRYIEQILSFFGVRVPDYTLQRPQFLGGGRQPVKFSEVLQTSSTDSTSPQGNMAGHAFSLGSNNGFKFRANEHGLVLGIMSVRPRTAYFQGLSRFLSKFDKFDFYFPQFAHLSEQEVLTKELYNTPTSGIRDTVFGYQERYAEYKFKNNEIHGSFQGNLDYWHLGRRFSGQPYLNDSFLTCTPSNRIFAVPSGNDHLYCQVYNNCQAVRPMPKHARPRL